MESRKPTGVTVRNHPNTVLGYATVIPSMGTVTLEALTICIFVVVMQHQLVGDLPVPLRGVLAFGRSQDMIRIIFYKAHSSW